MTAALFLLDPLPTTDVVRLDGPEGRHAATVRRMRVGEQLILTDGHGARRPGQVSAVGLDWLDLTCGPVETVPAPDPGIVVVQALPKGERAELALELLTELGADEIVPWAAARCIVQWRGDRAAASLRRWRRTVVEAGKQSRRVRWPVVADLADTAAVVARIRAAAATFVLHEEADSALAQAPVPGRGSILVVVGPEGGLTPDEVTAFTDAGAEAVRMGEPVLRTSTAGGAALAVLSARLGRWSTT